MTIGFLAQVDHFDVYRLLDPATATNSPPSGSSAGLDLSTYGGAFAKIELAELEVYSTAGSDTMTVTLRLWGYDATADVWFPVGTGADATKGVLNNGAAIGETGSNTIRHTEPLYDLHVYSRLYLEITAIGGTATSITANLKIQREAR